ncbi:hypothetical protein OnM2_077069 [Erysiphe neolycopersici]|uniref:Uncharacterized protein n=1 Tax=Erysiphe neolycopersici TaxID=212602 RepID=A0A420HHT1_9PEZI|nr:hypothetical protein OnM2_077069 [Erysiphe neolycopersici]
MPSAYHTFKLVPMAPGSEPSSSNLPLSTPQVNQHPSQLSQPSQSLQQALSLSSPQNAPLSSHQAQPSSNQQRPSELPAQMTTPIQNTSQSAESTMNPPPLPRNLITPTREMRESSVASSGGTTRKPRQNLDEHDHLLMVKHCFEQREHYKEGTKAQFWTGVGNAFLRDTGKSLAQMSATVGRLVESRRRQIADWDAGVISQKPGGELNDLLDKWMDFLKTEDGEAEAERMRQVDARRKLEEARKEARRQTAVSEIPIPPSNLANASHQRGQQEPSNYQVTPQSQHNTPTPRSYSGSYPHTPDAPNFSAQSQGQSGEMVIVNGHQVHSDINGYRSQKRKRPNESPLSHEMQVEQQQQRWHMQQQSQIVQQHATSPYYSQTPKESVRRVIVEGQLTKDDWKEIMNNDTRLRALEMKLERIETLVVQNNKILLQMLQGRTKDGGEDSNERPPVHLAAEFERDYL